MRTVEACYEVCGKFCLKIGALDHAFDQFLFMSAETYGSQIVDRLPQFPHKRRSKADGFLIVRDTFMSDPPDITKFGWENVSEFKKSLEGAWVLRDFISHGALLTNPIFHSRFEFSKCSTQKKSSKDYEFESLSVSLEDINTSIRFVDDAIVFVEVSGEALSTDRPGWGEFSVGRRRSYISIDLSDRIRQARKEVSKGC